VKVTIPEAFEGPEAAEIPSGTGLLELKLTDLPATALLYTSLSVTVIVEVVTPSAVIGEVDAATVD
jgi:hypothetical protein